MFHINHVETKNTDNYDGLHIGHFFPIMERLKQHFKHFIPKIFSTKNFWIKEIAIKNLCPKGSGPKII